MSNINYASKKKGWYIQISKQGKWSAIPTKFDEKAKGLVVIQQTQQNNKFEM